MKGNPRAIKAEERQYFDDHLEEYMSQFCRGRWLAYKRYVAGMIRRFMNVDGRRPAVLDLGSGPVPAFEAMIPMAHSYVCVDFSGRNLQHLAVHYPYCRLVMADAEELPFSPASFDLVISFGLLHHLPEPARTVREIERVLRAGGVLVAHEPSSRWEGQMATPNERGFTTTELRTLFQRFRTTIYTFDHPFPERVAAHFSRRVSGWDAADAPVWPLLFTAERALHTVGVRGWDFLIVARGSR